MADTARVSRGAPEVLLALAGLVGAVAVLTTLPDHFPSMPWIDRIQHLLLPTSAAVALVAALGFATGRAPRTSAAILVILIGLGAELEWLARGFDDRSHSGALPAAALLAWWVGDMRGGRRAAFELVSGVLAAAYLGSALSKLSASGLAWIDGDALALLMIERTAWTTTAWASLVRWVAHQPVLTWSMAAATLLIEAAGPLMLWPRMRRPFAMASVLLHAGIGVFSGYWHVEFPLVAVACALATPLSPTDPSDAGRPSA